MASLSASAKSAMDSCVYFLSIQSAHRIISDADSGLFTLVASENILSNAQTVLKTVGFPMVCFSWKIFSDDSATSKLSFTSDFAILIFSCSDNVVPSPVVKIFISEFVQDCGGGCLLKDVFSSWIVVSIFPMTFCFCDEFFTSVIVMSEDI